MEGKISIYIVEDLQLQRTSCEKHLNDISDFELIGSFGDAETCIIQMKVRPADVILMDLGLPGINGIEATREIKKDYPKTKIIILSSHQEDKDFENSLEAGADNYVVKECSYDKLESVIKATMYTSVDEFVEPQMAKVIMAKISKEKKTYNLTARELEVLKLLVQGKSNREISQMLHLSISTVKAHMNSIFVKLGVENRIKAAVMASDEKLV